MYDIAVVGAGAFGAWTALHLARAGRRVLLVDAWGAAHCRASSGGESRIIRMGYGADLIYTRMAMRSLELWQFLAPALFQRTGVLWMARRNDPYSTATCETLGHAQVHFELLDAARLAHRYPQFQLAGDDVYGIFEPESGVLMARPAVQAVVRDAQARGVDYAIDAVQVTQDGRVPGIRARTFVFACGPWLPKLFPALLGRRIYPTRQEVLFFAPPAGDTQFAPSSFPAWIDFTDPKGPYGFPDLESRGVKLAFDRHGPPFDPDTGSRTLQPGAEEEARRFLAARIPALCAAPLAGSRVCQYENTSNGDFLLDRHPEFDHIWLAGGGSGHGFKHGPAIGEYLAGRILEDRPAESRFSFAGKLEAQQRTVF
jgi:sarcosine oxidase